jgi:hypothetical protein
MGKQNKYSQFKEYKRQEVVLSLLLGSLPQVVEGFAAGVTILNM